MGRRKIPTTVYITPDQEKELKALHAKTRVPIAEYIRQGIDLVLESNRAHLPGQMDLYEDPFQRQSDPYEFFRKAADEKRR
jgi:hypothetical protein